jgi:tyrosine-protein phosphatase SIW14
VRHKKLLFVVIVVTAALAIAISTIVFGSARSEPRSTEPATVSAADQPLEDSSGEVAATLPLFHRVDENYVRGSQPMRGGISTLKRLGVKTVVDLRSIYDHDDDVKSVAEIAGLGYEWVPMSVWNPPTDEEANKFVSIVSDTAKGPFFVFCADGVNRTGEMTAIYRVVHNNWNVEKALDESDQRGFSPYYYTLRDYVWDYARKFRPSAVPPAGRRVSSTEP